MISALSTEIIFDRRKLGLSDYNYRNNKNEVSHLIISRGGAVKTRVRKISSCESIAFSYCLYII
jgi:hypothetical protein